MVIEKIIDFMVRQVKIASHAESLSAYSQLRSEMRITDQYMLTRLFFLL